MLSRSTLRQFIHLMLILYLGSVGWGSAQSLDSLRKVTWNTLPDSTQVVHLARVARACFQTDIYEARSYARLSLSPANRSGLAKYQVMAINILAITYALQERYDSSNFYLDQALALATKGNLPKEQVKILVNWGTNLTYVGAFDQAQVKLLQALDIAEQNQLFKGDVLGTLGILYGSMGNQPQAIRYYELAVQESVAMKEPEERIALLEGNLANGYAQVGEYRKARQLFEKVITFYRRTGNSYYLSNSLYGLGEVEVKFGRFGAAIDLLTECAELQKNFENHFGYVHSMIMLAQANLGLQKYGQYMAYSQKGYAYADSVGTLNARAPAAEQLARAYLHAHDIPKYFRYDSIFQQLNDSLVAEEYNEKLAAMATQYETVKKDNANLQLKSELDSQRFILVIVVGFLVAALVIIILVIRSQRLLRRSNQALSEKNAEIESQKQQIVQQNFEIEQKNIKLEDTIEEIRAIQSQLIQSEKLSSLGQMTAGIAHEINNPLNFISGGTTAIRSLLQETPTLAAMATDPEVNHCLGIIERGVDRCLRIVHSLKTYVNPNEEIRKPVYWKEAVEDALVLLSNKISEVQIQVEINIPDDLYLVGNPTQINQVLVNLVDNAIDAMRTTEARKLVFLGASEAPGHGKIIIRDSGLGIPDEIRSKIFDPFFSTKPEGTGLGLHISYQIIEEHGATLEIKPAQPGTEVHIGF